MSVVYLAVSSERARDGGKKACMEIRDTSTSKGRGNTIQ